MTRSKDLANRQLSRVTQTARLLLGFIFLINGINWWIKLLPYPSASDDPLSGTPAFVQAMIDTGYMFDGIRIIEVITGALLVANLWVPLALIVALPVTLGIWSVDFVLLQHSLRAQIMGWSVLLLNVFLLVRYFHYFAPILVARASQVATPDGARSTLLVLFGVLALAFGFTASIWLLVMAKAHLGL